MILLENERNWAKFSTQDNTRQQQQKTLWTPTLCVVLQSLKSNFLISRYDQTLITITVFDPNTFHEHHNLCVPIPIPSPRVQISLTWN